MRNRRVVLLLVSLLLAIFIAVSVRASNLGETLLYLPYIVQIEPSPTPTPTPTPTITPTPTPTPTSTPTTPPPSETVEFRGVWVTRFSWTNGISPASPATIDRIVDNAAYAGFNAILFQVRGTADAYYTPGLEPWAQRVSGGVLGQPPDPMWDPLAYFIQRAHERGIQLHAYINVYPTWHCGNPPPHTNPEHLYHKLITVHGMTGEKLNGLQWTTSDQIHCSDYRRATPASFFVDEHLMAVASDLVNRYDIDGLHLDHIRYGGSNTSCDPVSESRAGGNCFTTIPPNHANYGDWQRAQVNGTVARFYRTLFGEEGNNGVHGQPGFMLSAAVWPLYSSGYYNYYQDSKAWLAGGYMDALLPMLYGSFDTSPENWGELAAAFQADNAGRFVIPGIHGYFDNFDDIARRIEISRELDTAGHAIFAYNYLEWRGYFDDLAAGPYARPASPPTITWHP